MLLKLLLVLSILTISSTGLKEVLFLISSQDTLYHRKLSENLRNNIFSESSKITSDYLITVKVLHEIFPTEDWTLLSIIPKLWNSQVNIVNSKTAWIVWCEESTHINVESLLQQLACKNHSEALFLGYALHDREATIIHHFAFFENPKWFPYPLLQSGTIFTAIMLERIRAILLNESQHMPTRKTHFTIDVAHELALLIFDNMHAMSAEDKERDKIHSNGNINNANGTDGNDGSSGSNSNDNVMIRMHRVQEPTKLTGVQKNVLLQHAPYICPRAPAAAGVAAQTKDKECAMYAKPMDLTTCVPVPRACIYFAIKTCRRFHKERIPILESTWTPFTVHKKFFSDTSDGHIPTTSTGVPNINTGHCAKTLAIFKLALKDIEQMNQHSIHQDTTATHIHWLFLSDDDTLLSVSRLTEVLGCFNPAEEIYLGERYGYRMHATDGFTYITGGGGIAFSLPTIRKIIQHCNCPSPSAPDDMILGACLKSLKIKAVHSPRFHQARSMDYPLELLQLETAVSFHKFWQLDPLTEYTRWFATVDRQMLKAEHLEKLKMKVYTNDSYNCKSINDQGRCCNQKFIPAIFSTESQHQQQNYNTQKHIEL